MTASGSNTAFGPDSLPYGVFSTDRNDFRVGTRLGDRVVDLAAIAAERTHGLAAVLSLPSLNPLMAAGPDRWHEMRAWVREVVSHDVDAHSYPLTDVHLRLPFEVADYVDFYASEFHAANVGKIFRPNSPDLPAAWRHLPIGYHGRAGTVVVSGTDVARPNGQRRPGDDGVPGFGPSLKLDIECEVGFVVGQPSQLGTSVSTQEAKDFIFGLVLLNDWSARDIQAWEYVPLGPFLGKSFATSVSAWVTPMAALDEAHVSLPGQSPPPLEYLAGDEESVYGLDLDLTVLVNGLLVSQPHYKDMYWSPSQMLAHMTVNGASLRVGDLFASGTVSGPGPDTFGSLLERTWNGTEPLQLDGRKLTFLEDGDTVTIIGHARGANGTTIDLGEVTGTIVATR